jgi:hypothetical protein
MPSLTDRDDDQPSMDEQLSGEDVELEEESSTVEDTDDGGAIIKLSGEEDNAAKQAHFANIVEEVDAGALSHIVNDLLEKLEVDKRSREKRDKLYEEGLRRTGLGDDAPGGASFAGANKIVHPMLVEACVDFSARVMKEFFPPNGPVKSKIIGRQEKRIVEKAQRKTDFMNWQATEQMPEFRGELEQLSTQLPLGGAQYLKLMWSPQWRRPNSEFIAIDDILLPYAATNFYTAERKTHVQYVTEAEYQRRVRAGMYTDVDLAYPEEPEQTAASKANDRIEGRENTGYNEDGLRTIFEVYVHLDIEDEEPAPYILSIDKSTNRALSLYRNWEKDDDRRVELDWIVEFPFVPWRGAYPIGLTHMIGGLSGAATGALRALMDSAFIQNMPTALKLKGGPNGQSIKILPTELAEIDGGGVADDIRKLVMPVPFPGPSATLFQLLGFVVDAGKGVVQTSFEKLSDANANQPVGTTVALIEQGMVVFSSIHSRLHSSMGRVFKILHRINSAYLTEDDIEAQIGDNLKVSPADFDGPMDVVPVSDPHIFSETQRFAQTQAIMQRAAQAPQMYDARKVEEMFLRSMKVDDELLQPKPGEDNMDPASENVAAAMGRPIYVLPKQDHVAHLQLHMEFLKSPVFGQNPAIIKTFLYPMATHLRDHLLSFYLTEAHKGVELAAQANGESDAEQEVKLIAQVQHLIEQQLGAFAQDLAKVDQQAQQFAPKPPMPPDNSMQVAQLTAQVQKGIADQRAQLEQAKLADKQQERDQAGQLAMAKLQQTPAVQQQKSAADMERENLRQMSENQRNAADIAARIGMNDSDNQTAMKIVAAEIATGEKSGLSTGTGINPQ